MKSIQYISTKNDFIDKQQTLFDCFSLFERFMKNEMYQKH